MIRESRWSAGPVAAASGWKVEQLVSPSSLYGANGCLQGPDGRLYIAQNYGSQISALDIDRAMVEMVSPKGGDLVAVDDLAFDSAGVMYVTETMMHRVSSIDSRGKIDRVCHELIDVNGIACFEDRLFIDECRPAGRVCEIFRDGTAPNVLLEGRATPNAMAVGPDRKLYFPEVVSGEVWRVPIDGGAAERVCAGLAAPVAVKFSPSGVLVIAAAGSGKIIDCDILGGRTSTRASMRPGIDNLAFTDDGRLFVTWCLDGGVSEIRADGTELPFVASGLVWPLGLAIDKAGDIYAADLLAFHCISPSGGDARVAGSFFSNGYPGCLRGVCAAPDAGFYVTTAGGTVAHYDPVRGAHRIIANGYRELMGVAVAPSGGVVFAEAGTGRVLMIEDDIERVLADGLDRPAGVACAQDGSHYVTESGGGRVLKIDDDHPTVITDGLQQPLGIDIYDEDLIVVDATSKRLVRISVADRTVFDIATDVPVGAPPGVVAKHLPGVELVPGPLTPFTDVAVDRHGKIFLGTDGEGGIMAFSRSDGRTSF